MLPDSLMLVTLANIKPQLPIGNSFKNGVVRITHVEANKTPRDAPNNEHVSDGTYKHPPPTPFDRAALMFLLRNLHRIPRSHAGRCRPRVLPRLSRQDHPKGRNPSPAHLAALCQVGSTKITPQRAAPGLLTLHRSEIMGLWTTLKSDSYILLLFPFFWASNWFYT